MRRNNAAQHHDGKPIDVVYGVTSDGKTEIQALRYPKESWDAAAARAHCGTRGGRFEAASGEAAHPRYSDEEVLEVLLLDGYSRAQAEDMIKILEAGG